MRSPPFPISITSRGLNGGVVQSTKAIRPKFLDLKEGTLVILLELFVAGGGRAATERNVDDISAILDVSVKSYHSMDVSRRSGAGKFYVHHVDRAGYAGAHSRFETARGRSTRSRSSVMFAKGTPSNDIWSSASVTRKPWRTCGFPRIEMQISDVTSWRKRMSGRLETSSISPRSSLARAKGREEKASKFCVTRWI